MATTVLSTPTSAIRLETVRSLLTRKGSTVWSVTPSNTVYEAIALMDQKQVGALAVVVDARLVGIISERDYARKVILRGRSSRDTLVRDIMTSEVVTVTLDDTVDECMRIVTDRRIRHLPVLDAHRLAGMVSIGDLVRSIISAQEDALNHLNAYIGGQYPA